MASKLRYVRHPYFLSRLAFFILLCSMLIGQVSTDGANTSSFIVFSDSHVGRGKGSDGWNGVERLSKLVQTASTQNAGMVCCGDMVDTWYINNTINEKWYHKYLEIMETSGVRFEAVKGNHDCNKTKYQELIGKLNWMEKSNDMLFVGVGCMSNSGPEWLPGGIGYTVETYEFLAAATKSLAYNTTKYHFLFMHFMPTSTWSANNSHGVTAKFASYVCKFTMVFCGHEGNKASLTHWYDTPILKCAHLGDGKTETDTYLHVMLDRTANTITVTAKNFATNATTTLYKK